MQMHLNPNEFFRLVEIRAFHICFPFPNVAKLYFNALKFLFRNHRQTTNGWLFKIAQSSS